MNLSSPRLLILTAALTTLAASPAPAQNLTLRWFSIDGGGGFSCVDEYSLQSCIGQPDVPYDIRALAISGQALDQPDAALIDKAFLLGGYLPGTLGPLLSPSLAIRRDGTTTVVLSWQASPIDFIVQGSTNLYALDEEWEFFQDEIDRAGDDWEMNLRTIGPARYFRLIPAWLTKP